MDIPGAVEGFEKLRKHIPVGEEVKPSFDVMNLLSPEKREHATKLTSAMAEKFNVPESRFSVVATNTDNNDPGFTVAYSESKGLSLGSWNKIMANIYDEEYMISVDGQVFDTRSGMTLEVFGAMVEQVSEGYISDGFRYVSTWRTGEKEANFLAPCTNVSYYDDSVITDDRCSPGCSGDNLCFRPAVTL